MADIQPDNRLFKEEHTPELEGASYYAYLDSVEKIEGIYYIRFDCIDFNKANQIEITSETILDFPSVVIEISDEAENIDRLFERANLYNLESNWMVIKTELGQTTQTANQYFNFTSLASGSAAGNYGITAATVPQNLSPLDTSKISEIQRATLLNPDPVSDVINFLNDLRFTDIDHVNVYDVGQGSCNGLVTEDNIVLAYFDLGGGEGANQFTYPRIFKICWCRNPLVILSHWDQDHIEAAMKEPNSWSLKWLVPKQMLSNTAYHLANRLIQNGNLICWDGSVPIGMPDKILDFCGHRIVKCTGAINNKNNSGLALFIEHTPGEFVFLPGDARFGVIHSHPAGQITALVASHHGAFGSVTGRVRPGQGNTPPAANGLKMIAYSYGVRNGRRNTHKHAHSKAIRIYDTCGWNQAKLAKDGNIALKPAPLALTTPCVGNAAGYSCSLQIVSGQHY